MCDRVPFEANLCCLSAEMALSSILPSPSVPSGPAAMSGPPAPGDAGVFVEARNLLSQKMGTGGSWTGQLISKQPQDQQIRVLGEGVGNLVLTPVINTC